LLNAELIFAQAEQYFKGRVMFLSCSFVSLFLTNKLLTFKFINPASRTKEMLPFYLIPAKLFC